MDVRMRCLRVNFMNKEIQERILSWLPVVIWYGFIFFLSSIPGKTLSSIVPESYQFFCHRIAHFVEYSVLGSLVIRAHSKEKIKITLITIIGLSFFIFLSGSLDEWHQSFTPGRTPALLDAIMDTIWGTFAMLMYKMFVLNKHYATLNR
jgi:VanZ family protein